MGLSEAAVRQRVQKMREAGIMQIVAVTDPLQVGFRSQAMVGIRADGDTRVVAERLAAVDDIDYVVMCTGSFDILVELVYRGRGPPARTAQRGHPHDPRACGTPRRSCT